MTRKVRFAAQGEGYRHRAALYGGRTHLRSHVHRPPHGLRAEWLAHAWARLSANALQEHFTLPYAGQPPIPLSVPVETGEDMRRQTASDHEDTVGGVGLLTPKVRQWMPRRKNAYPGDAAQEKEKAQGLGNVIEVSTIKNFQSMSQQEDDLRALAKIMDFLRAVSIILVVMNVYWFCYEAIRLWGGHRRGGQNPDELRPHGGAVPFHPLHKELFAVLLLALSCLGTKGVKGEKIAGKKRDLDGTCRRVRAVLPQLVDTGIAAAG